MTLKNLKKSLLRLFNSYWPTLAIILTVGLFFWKFILHGLIPIPADLLVGAYFPWLDYKWGYDAGVPVKNPITSDVISFMYPMQTYAVSLLKSFQFPLWNPYILGGVPLLANFQSAGLNPLNILYFVFEKNIAWSFQIIAQHAMAIGFTYLLLRLWKLPKIASVFGGIIYAFSGFNMIWSQWNGHTLTAAYLPLFLYAVSRIFLEKRRIWILIASSVLGLQIYSGYPQIVIYTFVSLSLYWAVFKANLKVLFVIVILGIGLASPQLLPGVELFSHSQREVEEAHPYEWAFLPLSKVITFIAPDYYGNHATGNYWGPLDYSSHVGFVGVASILLATFTILFIRSRYVLFGVLLVMFSLLLSFPTPLSIFLWKNGVLGLQAAAAHRALILFNLGIALLAPIGLVGLINKTSKKVLISIIPAVIILCVFTILVINNTYQSIALKNLVIPWAACVGVAFILAISKFNKKITYLIIPISIFELFYVGWKFTPFSRQELIFPTTPVIQFLQQQKKPFRVTSTITPVNFLMTYGIETIGGYDAVYPARNAGFISAVNNGVLTEKIRRYALVDQPTSKLLNIANLEYLIINKSEVSNYDSQKYKTVFEDRSVSILENTHALPRAYITSMYETETNPDVIIQKLHEGEVLSGEKIIVEQPVSFESNDGKFDQVEFERYEPQQIVMHANASQNAMLFLSNTYYPGWKALVNGNEAPIVLANFTFSAVEIPAGENIVEFRYDPLSLKLGLIIASISICALILVVWKKDL